MTFILYHFIQNGTDKVPWIYNSLLRHPMRKTSTNSLPFNGFDQIQTEQR
ncbi:hypothetical protein Enr17x_50150 [Gimesia fumaroli]|uniref:Uncharacterized protein n=1 Tax=Gimesia fumaroli TaxID=2527976 RepID=A0A518IIM3_9PLAN|nr:hypothetical protein Enr17x_50150 [Gimesia fumaroli]